jgi:hypothetical protein
MFGSLFQTFQKCGAVFPNGSRVVVAQGVLKSGKNGREKAAEGPAFGAARQQQSEAAA